MGFFSQWFKPKLTKEVFVDDPGSFKLVYSKKKRNIWTTELKGIHVSVMGSEEAPNKPQTEFLKNMEAEIKALDTVIGKKFKSIFKEAEMPADFNHWSERFKLNAVEVMMIHGGEAYWNLAFDDLKSPYPIFTLFFEGPKATDFSMDT